MYIAKIIDVITDSLANGEEFLSVELEIIKDKKVVDTRKYGFPVDTSEKEIKKEVKKIIDLYNKEAEMAILEAEKEAKKEKVNKTINKLKGESIRWKTH